MSDFDDMDEGETLAEALDSDGYTHTRLRGEEAMLSVPVDISELKQGIANVAADVLCKQLRREVLDLTHKAAGDAINEAVQTWAEQVVKEEVARPRKKTNIYGRETGEVLTLDELAASAAVDYMNAEVNARGDRPSYNDRVKMSRLQFLIGQAVGSTVEAFVKVEVDKAVAELRKTMATAAQKEMGEAVLRLLGVM